MIKDAFRELLTFLGRLEGAGIWYQLRHSREDAIMIEIVVPGERWEVEFVDYEDEVQIEVECFRSDGKIHDEKKLVDLFERFSDTEAPVTQDATDPRN